MYLQIKLSKWTKETTGLDATQACVCFLFEDHKPGQMSFITMLTSY